MSWDVVRHAFAISYSLWICCCILHCNQQVDLVQQLASIGVSWYQQNSVYLSTAGIKALMRLADTLAHITNSNNTVDSSQRCSWALILDPIAAAVRTDVELVVALAMKQIREAADQQQQQMPTGASHLLRSLAAHGSPSGSPRAARGVSNGGFAGSPLGPKGGAAARQAVAAEAEKQMLAMQLRVRSQQLVLMQRALASVHKSCSDSMSWEEQMQLLEVLAVGVDAAIAFNAGVGAQHQHSVKQITAPVLVGASAAQDGQQSQQSEPQQQPERSTSTMLLESVDLASAVSCSSSLSMSGLVGFGSYLQNPHGTSSTGDAATSSGEAMLSPTAATGANVRNSSEDAFVRHGESSSEPGQSRSGDSTAAAPAADASDGTATADVADASTTGPQEEQQQPGQVPVQPALAPIAPHPVQEQQQQQQQQSKLPAGNAQGSPAAVDSPITGNAKQQSALKRVSSSGGSLSAQQQPGSPGRSRLGAVKLPVLMVSSAESVEEVPPALMRLEAEGGLLLIEVSVERRLYLLLNLLADSCLHCHICVETGLQPVASNSSVG